MSVKIRPINRSDIKRMTPSESQMIKTSPMQKLESAGGLTNNVVSESIFGKADHSLEPDYEDKVYEDKFTRTGYIPLTMPVLNPFLAGRKAPVWRRILGLSQDNIVDIIDVKVCYDMQEQKQIRIVDVGTKTFDIERYIFGAEYLLMLLDEVDIQETLQNALVSNYLYPVLTEKEIEMVKACGTACFKMVKVPTSYLLGDEWDINAGYLYGGYGVELTCCGAFATPGIPGFTETRITEIYNDLFVRASDSTSAESSQFPYISLLINMLENGKDILRSQVLEYVFVLPYGFRPTIDKRVDALTIQYNKLVNANLELSDTLGQRSSTCYAVFNKYRDVVRYIRNIFIGDAEFAKSQRLKNYKSISDMITGKEGLMRGRMQGARVDYSGRTVITCHPDMPIDTIGVPRKMLYKIAEPGVIKGLKHVKEVNGQNAGFGKRNLSRFSTTSNKNSDSLTYEEYLDMWFNEGDRYGVIGRQPTLFYLGLQAFKIRPIDGDAIVLSPLVVEPFNADFDGDQMHFNMPVTKEAIREVKNIMAFSKHLRYPKNGEITVVNRHEIIYGLWMAAMKTSSGTGVHYRESDIANVRASMGLPDNYGLSRTIYDGVCQQKINVYDTVDIQGRVVAAGHIAIMYAIYGPLRVKGRADRPKWSQDSIMNYYDFGNDENGKKAYPWSLPRIVHYAVTSNEIGVLDLIEYDGYVFPAGYLALIYVSHGTLSAEDCASKGFKAKGITKFLDSIYRNNTDSFLGAINRLVKLGFSVAKIWPPNISTLIDPTITKTIQDKIEEFNEKIITHEEKLNIGLEIESEYTNYFNREWNQLSSWVKKYITSVLGPDNGYVAMMNSGGKGDKDNLVQIFGLKGRVQKNELHTFNAIISGSYAGQLTGMEHFVTAYGSRKGIADKVLATAEPGYLSRKLEHAGSLISIISEDCRTDAGMDFMLEDIVPFLDESQVSRYGIRPSVNATKEEYDEFYARKETQIQINSAKQYLAKLLVGRYCVQFDYDDNEGYVPRGSVYIKNIDSANNFINTYWGYYDNEIRRGVNANGNTVEEIIPHWVEGLTDFVRMRSVVYCECPCCKKCYGWDVAAGTQEPNIGRAVGFIAAQAIGEPGTQMTMKNFQKGGVVSEANLTSSFKLIEDYFEMHKFSNRKSKHGIISYDMLSPVRGHVVTQHMGNGTKRIFIEPDYTDMTDAQINVVKARMRSLAVKRIIVHEKTKLKDYVEVGDSFQAIQGNLDMHEVLKYRGYDKAVSYLALTLHSIFDKQDVHFKHFETIVAAMSVCILLSDAQTTSNYTGPIPYGKGSTFRTGSVITLPELNIGVDDESEPVVTYKTILGLKALPKFKADFFESILMESMDSYVPRAVLMNPNDSMTNPITRAAFGLNIGIGSDIQ